MENSSNNLHQFDVALYNAVMSYCRGGKQNPTERMLATAEDIQRLRHVAGLVVAVEVQTAPLANFKYGGRTEIVLSSQTLSEKNTQAAICTTPGSDLDYPYSRLETTLDKLYSFLEGEAAQAISIYNHHQQLSNKGTPEVQPKTLSAFYKDSTFYANCAKQCKLLIDEIAKVSEYKEFLG